MRSGQKLALSLLISVVLFALFSVAAFSGLFSAVEARFYQPKIMSDKKQRLESVLAAETEYFDALSKRFKDFSSADAVRSALSRDGSQRFMEARESLREKLFAGTTCLGGIRLIDKNGVNIHYSTYDSDILSKTDESKILKKYTEIGEVPFQSVNTDAAAGKIFFDEANMRITFSFPLFFDGTAAVAVFYTDPGDFNTFLYSRNLIDITGYGILLADSAGTGGFVFGLPNVARSDIRAKIIDHWKNRGHVTEQKLFAVSQDELEKIEPKIFFSLRNPDARLGFVAWIYDESVFVLSDSVKVLLLVLVFLTLFLLVFLVFSLKHDDMVVIKDRIKRFQLAFITEYVDRAQSGNLPADFSDRKELLAKEIKKSLGARGVKYAKEVDELLDHSWIEILSALGVRQNVGISNTATINPDELKRILEEILGSGTLRINASPSFDGVENDGFEAGGAEESPLAESGGETPLERENGGEAVEPALDGVLEEEDVLDEVPQDEEVAAEDVGGNLYEGLLDEGGAEEPDDSSRKPVDVSAEAKFEKALFSAKEFFDGAGQKIIEKLKKLEGFDDEGDDIDPAALGQGAADFFDDDSLRALETDGNGTEENDFAGAEEFFDADDLKSSSEPLADAGASSEFFDAESLRELSGGDEVEDAEETDEADILDEVDAVDEADEADDANEVSAPEKPVLGETSSVPLSEFSVERAAYNPGKDTDLSEPLKFTSSDRKKLVPDPKFSFQATRPDFSSLDEYFTGASNDDDEFEVSFSRRQQPIPARKENKNFGTEIGKNLPHETKSNTDKNIRAEFNSENQPTEKSEDMMPLLFTKFTADTPNDNPQNLQDSQDAIIQNADGTFRISRLPRYTKTDINIEFKQLVDSVLR